MKYIMLKRGTGADEQLVPIMFPDFLNHVDVAKALMATLPLSQATPFSAGSCAILCLSTEGKSTTLGVPARDEDAQVINVYDYSQGLDMPTNAGIEKMVLIGCASAIVHRFEP
jgi:hypothetical protein